MTEINCKVSHITFAKKETGFYILKVLPDGEKSLLSVKGSFPGTLFSVGLKVKFNGKYEIHPEYGRQLNATTCEIIPEKGRAGIITYLVNNVPSIGSITANRLYEALGDELITVIENDPDRIRSLPFLTNAQSNAIIDEWKTSSAYRTVAIYLADLGLTASQIKSVYSNFGPSTKDKISNDPYSLCECTGVGFVTADGAAKKLGIGSNDRRRVSAMFLFALQEISNSEGHMYATSSQISDYIRKIFKRHSIESFSHGDYISDSDLYSTIDSLSKASRIYNYNDKLYLSKNWDDESESARFAADMICRSPYPFTDLEENLKSFEESRGVVLSDEQREGFMLLAKSRFCVITGYPGTGKTLLISAFVHLFEKFGMSYSLLSPTGIAAKLLTQVTGKKASTIHRALGFNGENWEFHRYKKYATDAVIVDEMSMVDGETFNNLISALHRDTILILLGDSAQLPSVRAGYVLNNLMNTEPVPHVALTHIYRQTKQSDIIINAHKILNGERVNTSFNRDSEFVFLPFGKDDVVKEMCNLASVMKEKSTDFQIISPMYDGDLGVNNLNLQLRKILNPEFISGRANHLQHGAVDMYEGDRIMIIRNDYEKMIFNGDVGKIQRISVKRDEVEVKIFNWFDDTSTSQRYIDKIFTFKVEEARNFMRIAYACTIHRVQGKEIDYVLMPITMQFNIMLYRNLIYTAITRARKKVFIFGDPKAFDFAIQNDRETARNSALSNLIEEYYPIAVVESVMSQ